MGKLSALPLGAVFALIPLASADATVINQTYYLSAGNFVLYDGTGSVPPTADPVELAFTLSFDNAADTFQSTTGFVIDSFTLSYALSWSYNKSNDYLMIATRPALFPFNPPLGCRNTNNTYCVYIEKVSTAPVFAIATLGSNFDIWDATTFSLRIGAAPSPSVPEPATWAMMIGGFAAAGAAMRHRRPATLRFA